MRLSSAFTAMIGAIRSAGGGKSKIPTVSFLITAYNCERYVAAAVRSALFQNFDSLEVLVVDDGSTDATGTILRGISDDRLRIISQGRVGRQRALNAGIAHARGRYIAILDADDLALPHRARIQAAFLQANPDVALVGSRYRTCIDEQGLRTAESVEPTSYDDIVAKFKAGGNGMFHSSVMFDKARIEAIGGYDTGLSALEDWDLYVRTAKRFQICNLDIRFALKRIHDAQFFGGKEGVHSSEKSNLAYRLILERTRELKTQSSPSAVMTAAQTHRELSQV